MNKKHLPFDTDIESEYSNLQMLFGFERGAYYFASSENKYYIICDSRTMSEFLDESDKDLLFELLTEYEFKNKGDCRKFLDLIIAKNKKQLNDIRIPSELLLREN